jgi:propionyl-CoA carboxylase alpha chain
VLQHKAFVSGDFDTNFIKHHYQPEMLKKQHKDEEEIAAWMAAELFSSTASKTNTENSSTVNISQWKKNRVNLR